MEVRKIKKTKRDKFDLGTVVLSDDVLRMEKLGADIELLIRRHSRADWGHFSQKDKEESDLGLVNGWRVRSLYFIAQGDVVIITESDREETKVLSIEEYEGD